MKLLKENDISQDDVYEGGDEEEMNQTFNKNKPFNRCESEKDLEPSTPNPKPMVYSDPLS